MSRKGMEDVLDGIKTYFVSNLEAALVSIETTRSVTIYRWEILDNIEVKDFGNLTIEILPHKEEPIYSDDVQPMIDDHWVVSYVDIYITMSGSDSRTINFTLFRYEEAIRKMIRDDSSFGGLFNWISWREVDYSPMVKADQTDQLQKIMTVSVQVRD